ncbi:N-acetylneuraminate lyase [Allomuricauda ruestringensis DSM 13258]|uniref:N-acetylneuraminate lyase n=1 Tax=Allomuricauda ruestringensis (strain DSM 13258 / CIP 107369 / LMG 19739 / B1) TaxID=886377 RepID=G2PS14_ALLRU|nr:dihydrodipicolinate synthase family protein [Allomuricauda ruestringensis]AEM69604.1 N-acetylneuraminate lyase [Allomuricauda ruestringensis DSM 13258]
MKGIIAATYAPMDQNGLLNTDIIEGYGSFLVANKVSGAFVNGSTGDFTALSSIERKELIEVWSQQRSEGLFLINHVGHNNLKEAVELAAHSADMVDATAALPPFYFRPKTLDDLVFYCKQIAQAAPGIPFYYYHIPILTKVSLPMLGFIEKAKEQIPNFAGIKYTEDNLSDFKQCVHKGDGSLDMFFGIDEKYIDSIRVGAQGWVGSTYNHLAPLYHEVARQVDQDRWDAARKLQGKAIHFVQVLEALGGYHGGGKSFMRYFGLDMGPSRFPHKTFNDSLLSQAIRSFEKEGLSGYLAKPFHGDSVV